MKRVVLLNLLFLLALSAAAQDDIPYIYYYSGALNGVVIERADGTDSRLIGQGLVDENVSSVRGPGWSPDGRWFAWHVLEREGYFNFVKGYVISADGQTTLDLLNYFPCVDSMLWHPTENILLVQGSMARNGKICPNGTFVSTYWLFDVDAQKRLAALSIDAPPESDELLEPVIYWFPKEQRIQFFKLVVAPSVYDWRYFLVTMSYDGTVMMEPVSEDETRTMLGDLGSNLEDPLSLFMSWTDELDKTIDPPPNSGAASGAVSGLWDTSGNWLLIGYEFCVSDCSQVTGRVNIFNPVTRYNREISDCGENPACVGWLPERVDIAKLPPVQPTSVLPEPQTMDYSDGFLYKRGNFGWLPDFATHELVCNTDAQLPVLDIVQNRNTGELDFELPQGDYCGIPLQLEPEPTFPTKPILFSLSPDGQYYAITDETRYTSLYDAESGERIATLNFYGMELSFSDDSRYLITWGRYATATWDIETLLTR